MVGFGLGDSLGSDVTVTVGLRVGSSVGFFVGCEVKESEVVGDCESTSEFVL